MARSKGEVAAWIGAGGVVAAAMVAGLFALMKPGGSTTTITTAHRGDSPIIITGEARDIRVEYNVPESRTREAIAALEKKLEDTGHELKLHRADIELLAQALKDLDQRTSGIEKLPDGRTMIGNFVTGQPTILLQEHAAAAALYQQAKYQQALGHSETAISVMEASARSGVWIRAGDISPEDKSKVYLLAAMSAQRLNRTQLALKWGQKAVSLSRNAETAGFLVSALANAGRRHEAIATVEDALASFPSAPGLLVLQRQLGASGTSP